MMMDRVEFTEIMQSVLMVIEDRNRRLRILRLLEKFGYQLDGQARVLERLVNPTS